MISGMFWNHCIIALRKLKKRILLYGVSIAVSTIGFTCLISSFSLFREYGHVSVILLSVALVIFLSSSINNVSYKYSLKEVSIRKLLGAKPSGIYKLILTESIILSILSALFSLIVLDSKPFGKIFTYNFEFNIARPGELLFLSLSVIIVSILIGLFPTYKLVKSNLTRNLRTF